MDNQTSLPNQDSATELKSNEQDTIFKDGEFSLEGYDKSIRNARTALFVVAGMQLLFGIIIGAMQGGDEAIIVIVEAVVLAAIFFGLGMWTKSKPYTAIVTGLVLFVGLHILNAVIDPASIGQGIIMKVVIIVYLAKSINDAKEAQEMKKNFDNR
ncbi:MAG: hypothetical protein V4722_25885 [Bacteroidota bacterium]